MPLLTWHANVDLAVDDRWLGVGQYPTPRDLASAFATSLATFIQESSSRGIFRRKQILIADVFAGDGRLGSAVRAAFKEKTRASVYTTFVECDPSQAIQINGRRYPGSLVVANAFVVAPSKPLDVIVANPPYLALNREMAKSMGLKWREVLEGGRNLYGLALRHAIGICGPGAIVGFIAPFGWMRGHYSRHLRRFIGQNCSHVLIKAHEDRRLFDGAEQDVAFQFFIKRKRAEHSRCDVSFACEDRKPVVTYIPYQSKRPKRTDRFRVRVGAFVWNRNKRHTRVKNKRGTVRVLYGGNIGTTGTINIPAPKYRQRQYAKRSAIPKLWLRKGPALVIRRTLRGKPGSWKADLALVPKGQTFVPENHVIVIEPASKNASVGTLRPRLIRALKRHFRFVGAPNLTAHKVKDIVRRAMAPARAR